MLQRDYIQRLIREFMAALERMLEKKEVEAAVMANTAIATAGDIPAMAEAFKKAIEAGRTAYLSGLGRVLDKGGSASSPLTGYIQDGSNR